MRILRLLNADAGFLPFFEASNNRGGFKKEFATEPVATKRCRVRPASARERQDAGQDQTVLTHVVYFEPIHAGITEDYPKPRRDDTIDVTFDTTGVVERFRLLSEADPSDAAVFACWRCEAISRGR